MATLVGETTLVKGHLEGDEDLTVLGRVEGSVSLTRTLTIESSGIVKAEVSVRNCVVSGVVVGNITATDSVELTEQARVVGDITAPRVIIVDGASFRGHVDMGQPGERPQMARPAATTRPAVARSAMSTRTSAPPARSPLPPPPARTPPTPPPRPQARQEATVSATAAQKKAPTQPPKPPRASGTKKKVKVKRGR